MIPGGVLACFVLFFAMVGAHVGAALHVGRLPRGRRLPLQQLPRPGEPIVFLQLVAYAEAHNELYGTEIREGHVFMCSRDGLYQQFDLLPEDFKSWESKWWDRVYLYYDKYFV